MTKIELLSEKSPKIDEFVLSRKKDRKRTKGQS